MSFQYCTARRLAGTARLDWVWSLWITGPSLPMHQRPKKEDQTTLDLFYKCFGKILGKYGFMWSVAGILHLVGAK